MQRDDAPAWLTDARVQSTVVPDAPVASPISDDVLNAVAIEISDVPVGNLHDVAPPSDAETDVIDSEPLTETGKQRRARKTRPTLPAWDNIV
jgi:hypothetical protein